MTPTKLQWTVAIKIHLPPWPVVILTFSRLRKEIALTGVFCCNRRFSVSADPTKLSLDAFCSDMMVFGVVVEFESDSFSKLPAASSRSTTVSFFTLPGNSNSESRLKLGELKSDRLDDDEFGESGRDSTFGFGSIPSGNCNDMGG